jgi:formylmethanofuran dehydrogenase subunit A
MLTRLTNGKIYDPANGESAVVRDIYIRDGRIVPDPGPDERIDTTHDLSGCIVMAGAIDMHTHIGGGKVTLGRIMLGEDHQRDVSARTALKRSGSGLASPSTFTTGYRYAEMGYTSCFEPAMLLSNARQSHLEMSDTPMIDKGAYVLLGNDDYLLQLMATGADPQVIRDYVGWTLHAAQALAIKVVNPGGINAFKFNQRSLDIDEANSHYGVTPRQILQTLSRALVELGVPHPLHVHGCNLGVPGSIESTLKTINGVEGLPIHLTHIQFHTYGTEGDRRFSSGASRLAEAVNANPNISVDVGQILFGQTLTASGDTMRQYAGSDHAHPKKWVLMDIECEAGCGVVPFRYRDKSFVNALQWAIGLEIFLQVEDPWRVFLTTDHPNGAPFTTYPHLIRLLMDRTFRNDAMARIHPDAAAMSNLGSIDREYTLDEIAIMTRAGPARSLGLRDRGHLAAGAAADITVYREQGDPEAMFGHPVLVLKDGRVIVREGEVVEIVHGGTHVVRPEYDRGIERDLSDWYQRYGSCSMENIRLRDEEIEDEGRGALHIQPCDSGGGQ